MVQRSAYEAKEIIEMINSEDVEEQAVGARNLWAFWNGWIEDFEGYDKSIEFFSPIIPRLIELLKNDLDTLRENKGYSQPRHIWHFILTLGVLNSKEGLPLITEILLDSSILENVRGFAADALTRYPSGSLDESLLDKLWEFARTDDSLPVRVNCYRAIASNYFNTKNDKIAKMLWEELEKQDNPTINTTLMIAIGEIGSKIVVPDLVHALITRHTGAMKKDAGLALDRIAELNNLANRDDLIKTVSDLEME
jgi:hypothetical protein